MKTRKKLIEVALPLEAINKASAREKSIRHGHPSTLHLWWARRPLAAARAVIFAQMVDDPSTYVETLLRDPSTQRAATRELKTRRDLWERRNTEYEEAQRTGDTTIKEPGPEPTLADCAADLERQRLFRIIEDAVLWENTTNEQVLERARAEIWQSWRRARADNADHPRAKELFDRHKLPPFHDPFAGGGALPLEAQRLGLEAYASDLNPVAVLINKAMIEIPPKFAGLPPVNPEARAEKSLDQRRWRSAQGLAEDVRYYGQWMRDEAEKRIGDLFPKVEITAEMAKERPDLKPLVGRKLTVIAWLWARTVKSPNPAFRDVDVPLASTFMLSTKAGKEVYVEPLIEHGNYRFTVRVGKPQNGEAVTLGTTAGKRGAFRCLMSDVPITYDHIRQEGKAGRMGARMMASVAEGERRRVYLSPTPEMQAIALKARPMWQPDNALPVNPRDFKTPNYGLTTFADLFTPRQLVALTTFSDLVQEARERVKHDALASLTDDSKTLAEGGGGATAYAEAVEVYLAFALGKALTRNCTQTVWYRDRDSTMAGFSRQAIAMTWDFAEVNPLLEATGSIAATASWVAEVLEGALATGGPLSFASQFDATEGALGPSALVSTDPPYYDNIGYADLSDFFYVWLRRSLKPIFPSLFATLVVPKAEELVDTSKNPVFRTDRGLTVAKSWWKMAI
jgi:putative DNA methylase